jgi:hypothetical protein
MKNRNIPTAGLLIPLLLAAFPLVFLEYDARAQSAADLPEPTEPELCGEGYWCADFNQAMIACYEGSMKACDSIWLNDRVLYDTLLSRWARECGGRVDRRAIQRADLTCAEAFPGH